jgi:hypothetical protein
MLAAAVCGVASADTIISYTATIPSQSVELTNSSVLLPAWDPGGSSTQDTTKASDGSSPSTIGGADTAFGVLMSSLNTLGVTYNLVSYDILVTTTINGSFTATNNANSTTSSSGSAQLNTYTAVALGSSNSPALTNTADPLNDLFYSSSPAGLSAPGEGANALSPTQVDTGSNVIAPGATKTTTFNGTGNAKNTADLGQYYVNGSGDTAGYTPITTANQTVDPTLALVTTTDPLDFFFSTATTVTTALSGNPATASFTKVAETVTVVYDFTTSSSTPEPTTMVLMGGALVGIGLLRKRVRGLRS